MEVVQLIDLDSISTVGVQTRAASVVNAWRRAEGLGEEIPW